MTPLEALVELTLMGVDENRVNGTRVRDLPRLYDIVMEECGPAEGWVHLIGRKPCDSELRFSMDQAGILFKCHDHNQLVWNVTR